MCMRTHNAHHDNYYGLLSVRVQLQARENSVRPHPIQTSVVFMYAWENVHMLSLSLRV